MSEDLNFKVVIIHPIDESTDFLADVYFNAAKEFSTLVKVLRVAHGENDNIKQYLLSLPEGTSIFFLGHGASNCMYGASVANATEKNILINKSDLVFFNKKNLFSLSCDSADFLYSNRNLATIESAVGFGYIPSSYSEVVSMREHEYGLLPNITEKIIEQFKIIVVKAFGDSLIDFLTHQLTFKEFYFRFRLRINKQISEVVLEEKSVQNSYVSKLLYNLKADCKFISD